MHTRGLSGTASSARVLTHAAPRLQVPAPHYPCCAQHAQARGLAPAAAPAASVYPGHSKLQRHGKATPPQTTHANAISRRDPRRSRPPAACSTPGFGSAGFVDGLFNVDMQVRDYELDQFNVVNNAVYASYLQHARHEAFASLGHEVDEFARRGNPLALSELNMSFKAPLRSRDVFRVTAWVHKLSAARVVMGQQIELLAPSGSGSSSGSSGSQPQQQLQPQVMLTAFATVVFLDDSYRPVRIPGDLRAVFQAQHDAWLARGSSGSGAVTA